MEERDFVVHLNPVRRERADFVINADIGEEGLPRRYEQLWARQLADTRFELCCIPFFVYDLALGDEVSTAPDGDRQFVLDRVVRPSGGFTFRAWFGDSSSATARDDAMDAMRALGAELEWHSQDLLAIHAADDRQAQQVADDLLARDQRGELVYETGRTH